MDLLRLRWLSMLVVCICCALRQVQGQCPTAPPTGAGPLVAAVNCGGPAICGWAAGATASFVGGTEEPWPAFGSATNPYASVHFGPDFHYSFPVVAGNAYTIRLHFSEVYWTSANARIFNVLLGPANPVTGVPSISNLDVFLATGARFNGTTRTVNYTAPAGSTQLWIRFQFVVNQALVSGIEVFLASSTPGASSPPPRPPPPPPPPATVTTSGCPAAATGVGTRLYAVNCGGPAICTWGSGTSVTVSGGAEELWPNNTITPYASVRFGAVFTYTFPLTGGAAYVVRLHFSEVFWTAAQARVFNVLMGPSTAALTVRLSNVDVYAATGGRFIGVSYLVPYPAPAGSTALLIQFAATVNNALVSGIEIFSASGTVPTTSPPPRSPPPPTGTPLSSPPPRPPPPSPRPPPPPVVVPSPSPPPPPPVVVPSPSPLPPAGSVAIYEHCGPNDYTDPATGILWIGKPRSRMQAQYSLSGTGLTGTGTLGPIYAQGCNGNTGVADYAVPSGCYEVTMYVVEYTIGSVGGRGFTVSVEGFNIMSIDIFARFGLRNAGTVTGYGLVRDGRLNMGFQAYSNSVLYSGLSIRSAAASFCASWPAAAASPPPAPPLPPAPASGIRPRVLIYTRSNGYIHGSISMGADYLQQGFARVGILSTISLQPSELGLLGSVYQGLVLFHTSENALETYQAYVTNWLNAGGALLGVHAAADTDAGLGIAEMLGAVNNGHPAPFLRQCNKVGSHPATDFFPATWTSGEEPYIWLTYNYATNNLLIECGPGPGQAPNPAMQDPQANDIRKQVWWRNQGTGRVFYTSFSHDTSQYANQTLMDNHWVKAMQWTMRMIPGPGI